MKKIFFKNNTLDILILIVFASIINFIYGSLGVLSQDTFAYFDTAYRILQGSKPFVDYWTVSGPFIDFFQAFLFLIFGISWNSYILGGCIINSGITILLYVVFKEYQLSRKLNLFYCICFSILANPSMGVPFPDHFSTFFSLAGILSFLYLIKKRENYFWLLIPFLFFIAFFSKQTPATYLFISFLFILSLYYFLFKKTFFIKYFLISSAICLSIFSLILFFNGISYELFLKQYISYPQSIGSSRINNFNFNLNNLFNNFKFIYLLIIFLIYETFKLIKNKKILKYKEKFLINSTVLLTCFSLIFHQILTMNFIFIFFLIPLISGFIQINITKKFKYNNFLKIFLIIFTLFTTSKYHIRFNEERKMLNLEKINLTYAIEAENIDQKLSNLKWITKNYSNNPKKEIESIKKIIEILSNEKKALMLYSDYIFLSSLLNRDLNTPTRWPGLGDASNPNIESKFNKNYVEFVKNLVRKKNIEVIYSTIKNNDDVFNLIFTGKCKKTKVISEFLVKHDIKNCN